MTDPHFFWRLHDELTVPNAAILMVGGDPSEKISTWDAASERTYWFQKRDYVGFEAATSALKAAILRGEIEAKVAFALTNDLSHPLPEFKVIASRDLWALLPEASNAPSWINDTKSLIQISRDPDWETTVLEVESLRRWLRSKGAADGFFVSTVVDAGDVSFGDPGHEHFSAELALAVAAWRDLASEQRFPRGPKATIEAWIDANPDAWLGEGDLSANAKERIVTLVNWRKLGGAPSSGG